MTVEAIMESNVPSSPADREKIFNAVKEMDVCLTHIAAQRDQMKAIVDRVADEFKFDKKLFRTMSRDYHKQSHDKTVAENEAYETAYTAIVGSNSNTTPAV